MAILRIDIERALDEVASQEEGMRFQGLAEIASLCGRPSASHIPSASGCPTAARLAPGWSDGHVNTAVHRLDGTHEGLKADVASLAGFQLGDHRLLDAEFRGELSLRHSAGVAKRNEFLIDLHRLQFRVDSRREIRIVFRALFDDGDGALGERHAYRPFFGFLSSAFTAACNARRRFRVASGMSSRFFVMPSSRTARFPAGV